MMVGLAFIGILNVRKPHPLEEPDAGFIARIDVRDELAGMQAHEFFHCGTGVALAFMEMEDGYADLALMG